MVLPLVSIRILNYNGGKVTENCLDSVLKTRYPNVEIILVDNGSTSGEITNLKKKYKNKISFIVSRSNLGYAGGNNLGAKKAKGKYLVFLNNDTVVDQIWLAKSIERMEQDPQIGFLQPKIKWAEYRNFFEYAGGAGGYLDRFGYPFSRGRIFGSLEEDIGQYNDEREIFWASGVALFCRKKVFEKLGRFDAFFFAYAEENDLCFRAHRAGYRVIYFPEEEIYHLGGYTSNRNPSKKVFFIFRNHLVLLIKNLRFSELATVLPLRLLMDIGAAFFYLIYIKSPESARSIMKAYISLVMNFPEIWRTRNRYKIKNFGYPKKIGLIFQGSIVWQYFVLRKERWGEIIERKTLPSKIIKIF